MAMTVRDYVKILMGKFQFVETRRTSHTFYELVIDGLPPVRTMASHNRKEDIGKSLERDLARELRVSVPLFRGMFACTNTCQDYRDWLSAAGTETRRGT